MNTLRVKIAVLLGIAIVSVMALMTFVLFLLLGPPPRSGRALDIAAKQVALVAELAEKSPDSVRLSSEPHGGAAGEARTQRARSRCGRNPFAPLASGLPGRLDSAE
jgi:hypothetical protein